MEGSRLLPGSGTHILLPGNVIHRHLDLQGERGRTLSHFTDLEAMPGAQAVNCGTMASPEARIFKGKEEGSDVTGLCVRRECPGSGGK